MKKQFNRILIVFTVLFFLFSGSIRLSADTGDYQLKEVVILSRHNIRAPLSTKGSILDSGTPHEWYKWSSNASELSLRGGILETTMGQYFRKWLESEELIPENYRPKNNEVRFYANAKQRTIATAQYFSSGFLPVANIKIETRQEYDKMDPVFTPQLTFVNDEYTADAIKQMESMVPDLSREYELLTDVIDFYDSDAYKNKELSDFVNGDIEFVLESGSEPSMKGSLKNATSFSDALVLQYYEEENDLEAAFGHELTRDQWRSIARITDTYGKLLFTAPLISVNVAHPLLQEIERELNSEDRLFSFLCGHDSNVASVLAALDVREYEAPEAVEISTPIGCKLVFEKWTRNSEDFLKVRLIYNSADQLRNISIMYDGSEPVSYDLEFNGLNTNEDGMYRMEDFKKHLRNAINAYDELISRYDPQFNQLPKTGIE